MAHSVDWVPANMEEFRAFADNFCDLAGSNKIIWKLVPDDVTNVKFFA